MSKKNFYGQHVMKGKFVALEDIHLVICVTVAFTNVMIQIKLFFQYLYEHYKIYISMNTKNHFKNSYITLCF